MLDSVGFVEVDGESCCAGMPTASKFLGPGGHVHGWISRTQIKTNPSIVECGVDDHDPGPSGRFCREDIS